MRAGEGGQVLFPQNAHGVDGLVGDSTTIAIGHTEIGKFVFGLCHAHTEHHPAAREFIEAGNLFGKPRGVMPGQHQHRGTQAHTLGHGRNCRQDHESLVIGPIAQTGGNITGVEQMFADPDRVITELLSIARDVDEITHRAYALVVGHTDSEFHVNPGQPHENITGHILWRYSPTYADGLVRSLAPTR